jgi:hypothetical protein
MAAMKSQRDKPTAVISLHGTLQRRGTGLARWLMFCYGRASLRKAEDKSMVEKGRM